MKANVEDVFIGVLAIKTIISFDSIKEASKLLKLSDVSTVENYNVIEVKNVSGKKMLWN